MTKPLDLLFWIRAGLGSLSGLIAGVLGFIGSNPQSVNGIIVALLFYVASYYLARYVLAIELPAGESRKLFTTGVGSFVMLFLFTWILYNTFVTLSLL